MTVIVCLDTKGGMTFNNRRQSRDSRVTDDIKRVCEGKRLLISPFSEKMLAPTGLAATVSSDPFSEAKDGEVIFVENLPVAPHVDRVQRIIVYNWNRSYPADRHFDVNMGACGFKLHSKREFVGSSHEKITREDYIK